MVTNADIARAAGVSAAVVSRIVNGDPTLRVSAKTRERVQKVIADRGYSPNAAARSLRSSRAGLIALLVHDVTNPVYAEIVSGAQRAAAAQGTAVLLGEASGTASASARIEELVGGSGIDGLILQGAGTEMDQTLARAAERSVPTVLLQSGRARKATLIRLDDEGAGRLAATRLIGAGHRRIGFIGAPDELRFAAARRRGWQSALRDAGLTADPESSAVAGSTFAEGAAAVRHLIAARPDLTALVIANVVTAIGALSELIDQGRSVPRDLSVIGIQDAEIAAVFRPALSVVRMPLRKLGEVAVDLICAPERSRASVVVIDTPGLVIVERSTIAAPRTEGG